MTLRLNSGNDGEPRCAGVPRHQVERYEKARNRFGPVNNATRRPSLSSQIPDGFDSMEDYLQHIAKNHGQ